MAMTEEQLAPIKAELARDGFLGTASSRALIADLEEARRERDEANNRAERVTNHAINLISRLCPDHLAEAKEMSFGVFMERTEKNGCEWCAVARAETAERERDEARAALRRTQWVYDSFCPGGSVPMGMICPVCANHRPEGHKPDCVVGNALGGSEQSS